MALENSLISDTLTYVLGFVGLAAISLLPLRSWLVVRSALRISRLKTVTTFIVLLVMATLWFDVIITTRVFKCLTDSYCGPNVASGWIYLAMLGTVYLAFEFLVYIVWRLIRFKDYY